MSNHLHVVQILPEVVSRWSNAEIVECVFRPIVTGDFAKA
jgi:hypothetical protein